MKAISSYRFSFTDKSSSTSHCVSKFAAFTYELFASLRTINKVEQTFHFYD